MDSYPKMPTINTEKLPSAEYYWHATLTGVEGEIATRILSEGLKPKSDKNDEVGNYNTPTNNMAYVSDSGIGAVNYLKNANGYNYEVGGLPMFVSVKVDQKNKDFDYDTDIVAGIESGDSIQNKYCWFALFLTYDTVDEFLSEDLPSMTGNRIQDAIYSLRGKRVEEIKEQAWKLINSLNETLFMEGQRKDMLLVNIDISRWDKFLTILNKIAPKGDLTGNLCKKNGWRADELKRVYVVTPNGDLDWKKWAKLIPHGIVSKWEQWSSFTDVNGQPIPGDGKMVRIN